MTPPFYFLSTMKAGYALAPKNPTNKIRDDKSIEYLDSIKKAPCLTFDHVYSLFDLVEQHTKYKKPK